MKKQGIRFTNMTIFIAISTFGPKLTFVILKTNQTMQVLGKFCFLLGRHVIT
jgi:hypothetical protein